jgi:hypothetical protein
MTTSERILSTIASRLAIMVLLGLLGHLPDQRHQSPIDRADAIEMSAAGSPASGVENRTDAAAGYAD